MAEEDDKRVLGLLLGGENAASRYDSVLFAGQGAQLVVIVVIVLVHLAFPLGDCRLDLDQLRGFFLGRIALASGRSEEHTSELQSLMRISYAVFCLKQKTYNETSIITHTRVINA